MDVHSYELFCYKMENRHKSPQFSFISWLFFFTLSIHWLFVWNGRIDRINPREWRERARDHLEFVLATKTKIGVSLSLSRITACFTSTTRRRASFLKRNWKRWWLQWYTFCLLLVLMWNHASFIIFIGIENGSAHHFPHQSERTIVWSH